MLDKNGLIKAVEKALNLKLHPWQIDYIFYDKDYPKNICPCLIFEDFEPIPSYFFYGRCCMTGRRTGKTLAYCIKLALYSDKSIDMKKPEEYSDRMEFRYARGYFKHMFVDVWEKLKEVGLPVVEIAR